MKRKGRKHWFALAAATWLLVLLMIAPCVLAADPVPNSVLRAADSVLRIEVRYANGDVATGTGFVIANEEAVTLLATNFHVVEGDPQSIVVWVSADESVEAEIHANVSDKDLCILALARRLDLPALPVNEQAKQGQAVYAVGFPAAADVFSDTYAHANEQVTITDGIVSAVRQSYAVSGGPMVQLLQTSAPINPGNSGGPLFNTHGEVIGVNTFGTYDSQGISAAIGIRELTMVMGQLGIRVTRSGSGFVWLFVGAGILVAAGGIGVFAVVKRRRRRTARTLPPHEPFAPMPAQPSWRTVPAYPGAAPVPPMSPMSPSVPHGMPQRKSKKEKQPRRPVSWTTVATVGASGVIVAAIVTYVVCFLIGYRLLDRQEFQRADNYIIQPIASLHDKKLSDYLDAGLLLQDGQYDAARGAFEALDGYRESERLEKEAGMLYAGRLMDEGDFENSLQYVQGLYDAGVIDTEDVCSVLLQYAWGLFSGGQFESAIAQAEVLLFDYGYSEAQELFYEFGWSYIDQEAYLDAYRVWKPIEGYADVGEYMDALSEVVYHMGIEEYRFEHYRSARDIFLELDGYDRSEDYLTLIDIYQGHDVDLSVVRGIFFFEDAKEAVVSETWIAQEFLLGYWSTADGYYYFEMEENGDTYYNLPHDRSGGYYSIEEGRYRMSFEDTEEEENQFHFYPVTWDSMQVYCYSDGATHTLYRR